LGEEERRRRSAESPAFGRALIRNSPRKASGGAKKQRYLDGVASMVSRSVFRVKVKQNSDDQRGKNKSRLNRLQAFIKDPLRDPARRQIAENQEKTTKHTFSIQKSVRPDTWSIENVETSNRMRRFKRNCSGARE